LAPVEGFGEEVAEVAGEVAGAPVWDVEGDAGDEAVGEPFDAEAAALDATADEAEVPVMEEAAEVAVEEVVDVWV
jgi:hypothetical protein